VEALKAPVDESEIDVLGKEYDPLSGSTDMN
jgi:hypothetical protein